MPFEQIGKKRTSKVPLRAVTMAASGSSTGLSIYFSPPRFADLCSTLPDDFPTSISDWTEGHLLTFLGKRAQVGDADLNTYKKIFGDQRIKPTDLFDFSEDDRLEALGVLKGDANRIRKAFKAFAGWL